MSHDDPFKALESWLAITPSPEFAARVRTRIAHAPERVSGMRWLSRWSAAALLVLGVGAALPVWQVEPVTVVRPVPVASLIPEVPAVVGAAAPMVLRPVQEARATPVTDQAPRVNHVFNSSTVVDASFTEVLVPPDQRIALVQLLRGIREGRTTVPASAMPDTEVDADGHVVPRALLINLLEIAPIPGTSGTTSKGVK